MRPGLIALLFGVLIFGLSNSSLHPTSGNGGYTGAPGDSSCGNCHTGNNANLDGSVTIDGLPASIETGETYTLTVTVDNPNGNALRAGFQMVALTGTNTNAGTMSNPSANTQIRVAGGKNYFGHAPAQNFPGSNVLSFNVDWTAPATAGSVPIIKFYASSVIGNGANGNQNDKVVFTNVQVPIQTAAVPLALSITDVEGVSCFGFSNGTATASATGGTPPYTFAWNNGLNTQTNNTLPAGTASVTVTDNAGNSLSANATIPTPPLLTSTTTGSTVCPNGENGTASVNASGGTGSKTYIWSNGMTTSAISGLSSGVYNVTVEDANGCTATNSAVVGVTPNPAFTGNSTNATCFNTATGSILLTLQGSPAGVTYQWSNGATSSANTNLVAGAYAVTVSNSAGCSSTASYTITQPQALTAMVNVQQSVSCYGGNNGELSVAPTGGTGPYTFQWSTGVTGSGLTSGLAQLPAATYQVSITDQQNCTTTATQVLSQPEVLMQQLTEADTILCPGETNGYLQTTSSGGTPPYQYSWSTGNTTSSLTALAGGLYTLTITDANLCSDINNYTVNQSNLAIDSVLIVQPTSSSANDGMLEVWFTGNSPLTFSWIREGVVIDTDSIAENIRPGLYFIQITDGYGCVVSGDSILLSAPSQVEAVRSTEYKLFPVPASDFVFLKAPAGVPISDIRITDMQGKSLFVPIEEAGDCLFRLQITNLPADGYLLHVRSKGAIVWTGRLNILAR